MFMRYQFGMSVGHTYMHAPSFPTPAMLVIPPNFDHCLDVLEVQDHSDPSTTEATRDLATSSSESLQRDGEVAGTVRLRNSEVCVLNKFRGFVLIKLDLQVIIW